MRPNRLRFLTIPTAAFALTLIAASGCHSTAVLPPGADNPGLVAGSLRSANPLDVAVLAIDNQTGREGLPTAELRELLHAGLVARHYSPLAIEYVDRKTTEASYRPGASNEDALLTFVLTGWDDSLWRTHSRLVIRGEIWLLDAERPSTTQALWGGKVERTMEMARERQVLATDSALTTRTLSDFTEAVLASLPSRKPEIATGR
ncbi:MAG TPA: hypothetical protein VMT18_05960 [Planctomycetota bacterium]|nr:hypothetical protein [Planctomycetota bacterium]